MRVGVVILNYKVKNLVIKCVESVRKSSHKDFFIVVVDNNSGDGMAEEIKKFPEIVFIQNKDNIGYSGGNNLGIKKALEIGAKAVFVLNPDTEIDKETIQYLVDDLENKVGITCPKIYFEDRKTIWYAGGIFDFKNVLGSHRGVNKEDGGQYDAETETDYATGAALMIKSEVLERVGLFDERYFLYYEDSDFSLRAKKAGYKVMYIPKAKVFHSNAKSTGLGSPLQDYFITRNRMLYASKFLPFQTRFALFREVLKNLKNPMRRLALFDFLIGNFGKGSFR